MLIRRFNSKSQMTGEAASRLGNLAQSAVAARGRFTMALSGGSTPEALYGLVAAQGRAQGVDWDKTHLFWGDERCLPPSDPASNYALAERTLIRPAELPAHNLHPIPCGSASPAKAAQLYQEALRSFFEPKNGAPPVFDLVLLGVGEDGHTASLFPGSPALREETRWVVDTPPPQTALPAVPRITLTLPVINAARNVIFLAGGKGKKEIVARVLYEIFSERPSLPAARVSPKGSLFWLVSEA